MQFVADSRTLGSVLEEVACAPAYALDTEFHREGRYRPKLALVQLAWRGGVVLIDPLMVDVAPLDSLFRSGARAVLHAADQDLDVLEQSVGTLPNAIFDTQLACRFVGLGPLSLDAACKTVLGVRLPKPASVSDWLRRPLEATQLEYAAADVRHLLDLADHLERELERLGRAEWFEGECETLLRRRRREPDPDAAWTRVKGIRRLSGRELGAAKALAAWRERRAARMDRPRESVLSDLALIAVARERPRDRDGLLRVRGLKATTEDGEFLDEILRALEASEEFSVGESQQERKPLPNHLRPLVPLLSSWLSEVGRRHQIDPTVVGTRDDIEESLSNGFTSGRLTEGWRWDLVGKDLCRIAQGEVGVFHRPGRGLILLTVTSHDDCHD
ncbi:MAG: ribonuclease D [Acidimicrobiales bacterium]|nr:MAG: ribonuclease D [Acidimicrobiales bacterium]